MEASDDRYYYDYDLQHLVTIAHQLQTKETYPGVSFEEDECQYVGGLGLDDTHGALILKASQEQYGMVMRLRREVTFNEKWVLEYALNNRTQLWEIRSHVWVRSHDQKERLSEKPPRIFSAMKHNLQGKSWTPTYTDIHYLAVFSHIVPEVYTLDERQGGIGKPLYIKNLRIEAGRANTFDMTGLEFTIRR